MFSQLCLCYRELLTTHLIISCLGVENSFCRENWKFLKLWGYNGGIIMVVIWKFA